MIGRPAINGRAVTFASATQGLGDVAARSGVSCGRTKSNQPTHRGPVRKQPFARLLKECIYRLNKFRECFGVKFIYKKSLNR